MPAQRTDNLVRKITGRLAAAFRAGFGRLPAEPDPEPGERRSGQPGPFTLRRWEAADSNRLNQAHWQNATGQSINLDLLDDLETLRARCAYEAANNGIVEGVINTHAEDIVGRDGPTLQVESDDAEWNEEAERVWRNWFRAPCPDSRISGAAWLKTCVQSLWRNGEFLAQLVTGRNNQDRVTLRVKPIHPRRLATPLQMTGNPNVFMGIEFDQDAVPTRYHITDAQPVGAYTTASLDNPDPIPPDLVIHEFVRKEEDQARGYPWLSAGLDPAADIRDYDAQVLDAARAAADAAIVWYTEHNDAVYHEVNESASIERRCHQTGPPGWKPMQVKPEQPAGTHVEYRRERQAEIGRPVCMPLMTIRLDASGHSYSSARFDGQNYHRSVDGIQIWLSGSPQSAGCLSRLFWDVIAEARLSNPILRRRPRNVSLRYRWPVPPHVDPTKEGQAERTGLENGTLPFAAACAARGYDEETVFAAEKRTNEKRAGMGLAPLPPAMAYLAAKAAAVDAAIDDDDEEEETADKEGAVNA